MQNHSNLRTVSQHSNTYQQLHQKPDEALQTYNTRYISYFNLTYPKLEIDNPLSRMHCIHYASSLYGKLSDEMTGRFNQDVPENLHTAFEKAANFKPHIITKQSINERRVHDINHIDVTSGQEEIEINEAYIRNPNYKGKNYDPNYQQNKTKTTSTIIAPQEPATKAMETKAKEITIQRTTTRKTSQRISHVEWTCQQGTTVQDTRSTETSITVQG